MAKSGPAESGLAAARVGELKKELRRLVRAIAEEDDSRIEKFEGAARALAALKDLRFRGSGNSNGALASQRKAESEIEAVVVPEHFLCPISAELMRDPVVVASGQVRYLWDSGLPLNRRVRCVLTVSNSFLMQKCCYRMNSWSKKIRILMISLENSISPICLALFLFVFKFHVADLYFLEEFDAEMCFFCSSMSFSS